MSAWGRVEIVGRTFVGGARPETRETDGLDPIMVGGEVCKGTWTPRGIGETVCVSLAPGEADEVLGCVGRGWVADDDLCSVRGECADTGVDDA